jgi:hypothetical protein
MPPQASAPKSPPIFRLTFFIRVSPRGDGCCQSIDISHQSHFAAEQLDTLSHGSWLTRTGALRLGIWPQCDAAHSERRRRRVQAGERLATPCPTPSHPHTRKRPPPRKTLPPPPQRLPSKAASNRATFCAPLLGAQFSLKTSNEFLPHTLVLSHARTPMPDSQLSPLTSPLHATVSPEYHPPYRPPYHPAMCHTLILWYSGRHSPLTKPPTGSVAGVVAQRSPQTLRTLGAPVGRLQPPVVTRHQPLVHDSFETTSSTLATKSQPATIDLRHLAITSPNLVCGLSMTWRDRE